MAMWIFCISSVLTVRGWGQGRTRLAGPKVEFSVGGALAGTIADYKSVQEAVSAAPPGGAVIRIRPGVYREVVHVDRAGIELRGDADNPEKIMLVFANGAANTCGTFCSATLFVTGDDFYAEGITVVNDWGRTGRPRTQAVALSITGDRAVLRHVRLLGAQDTLMAGSKKCETGTICSASRQYFEGCYVEGDVDLVFGGAKAVFEGCELRSVAHEPGGYVTAQSRQPGEDSGFVFDKCRLTANVGAGKVYLGRPWRDDATVIFLHTEMGAHIQAAGWAEWPPGETTRLKTATFAEYESTGPGASTMEREGYSRQLTAQEAKQYEATAFLRGVDGWNPGNTR